MKEFEENEKLTDPEAVSSAQDDLQTDFAQEETAAQPVADRTSETEQPSDAAEEAAGFEESLDKNVRLMSPGRMVARRFFRSKLSIIGLVIIAGLLIFSWFGPVLFHWCGYEWSEQTIDQADFLEYGTEVIIEVEGDGETYTVYQVIETIKRPNMLAAPSGSHWLGTDKSGMDVFIRLMYGGRVSLSVSVLTVFIIAFIGIIFGGIAGYFGKAVDNVIMRICDILMCIPGLPIMLIVGSLLEAWGVDPAYRIYCLMLFLTLISWPGTARLVRGQILSLREQEYMVAAEAMGFSTKRKIFKHLVPNVLPQLIVSMTLSLGSMIIYEATLSYLGMGVQLPSASWGTMINIVSEDTNVLNNYFNVWGPPGICIILAVLGFNFIGDGLRDALDPKMRR